MPSCQRAWPSRLMREKGDVSVMYSYLLIESPMGQKVRRSHLWCLPRQLSHTLRSLLLPHCSVFWHFSCKHNPQEVKNRIVFCCLSSFPYKKVKWRKCRLVDKKCYISQCVVLILHRLLGKMLGHVSLGHRALIMEENPSCLSEALSSLIITNLGIANRFQKVPPVWGTRGKPWFVHLLFQGRTTMLRIVLMLWVWPKVRHKLVKKTKLVAGWDEREPEFLFFVNESWDTGPDSLLVFNSVLLCGSC